MKSNYMRKIKTTWFLAKGLSVVEVTIKKAQWGSLMTSWASQRQRRHSRTENYCLVETLVGMSLSLTLLTYIPLSSATASLFTKKDGMWGMGEGEEGDEKAQGQSRNHRIQEEKRCLLWLEWSLSILLLHHLEAVVFKFTGVEERDYGGGPPSLNYLNPEVPYLPSTESSGQN